VRLDRDGFGQTRRGQRGPLEPFDRESARGHTVLVDRVRGPTRAISVLVDDGDRDFDGIPGCDFGGSEGDDSASGAGGNIDLHGLRQPASSSVPIGVDTDQNFRSVLGEFIDTCSARTRANHDVDLFAWLERATGDLKRRARDSRNQLDTAIARHGRRKSEGLRIRHLGLAPGPVGLGHHEEDAALIDPKLTDFETELDALDRRRRNRRPC